MARPEWLRTFLAVYRAGSVTEAARLRGLSQPATSQQLAGLERAIGTALFVRTPSGVVATERGLSGLAFADPGEEKAALADMKGRWPKAHYSEDTARTAPIAQRIFDPSQWRPEQPLRVVLIGTDWEVRVWDALLQIPMGRLATYSGIAGKVCTPNAARAVGAAVGKNPVSFVVPCHRVVGKSGDLTGYHWGITRKRAMLGWEAGQVGGA